MGTNSDANRYIAKVASFMLRKLTGCGFTANKQTSKWYRYSVKTYFEQ